MDLHVRPNASGTGFVAYDDDGHSAGGSSENDALIAFHTKHPEVKASGIDIAHEPVDMVGTPEQEAKHQALLNGEIDPEHAHGPDDFATCMRYIHGLAGRVQAIEDMLAIAPDTIEGAEDSPATPEAQAEFERMRNELEVLKRSLATDWRNFVFQPSHAEVMLLGLIPLVRSLVVLGPNEQTMSALGAWFESIAAEREILITIAGYLLNEHENLPPEVRDAVRRLYER
jgi:hypothetical protein